MPDAHHGEEPLGVGDLHPDASVRDAIADRGRVVGSVDADAGRGEPHPARPERISRPGRDRHGALGPRRVRRRHPGWVLDLADDREVAVGRGVRRLSEGDGERDRRVPEPLQCQEVGGLVDGDPARQGAERVDADRSVDRESARLLERPDRGHGAGGVDAARLPVQIALPAQKLLQVGHVLPDRTAAEGRLAEVLGRIDDEPELLLGAVSGGIVSGDRQRVAPL